MVATWNFDNCAFDTIEEAAILSQYRAITGKIADRHIW